MTAPNDAPLNDPAQLSVLEGLFRLMRQYGVAKLHLSGFADVELVPGSPAHEASHPPAPQRLPEPPYEAPPVFDIDDTCACGHSVEAEHSPVPPHGCLLCGACAGAVRPKDASAEPPKA